MRSLRAASLALVVLVSAAYAGPINILSGSRCFGCTGGSSEPPGEALFADDFSSGNLAHTENGFNWDGTVNVSVVSSTLIGGTHAARFVFGPNTTDIADDSTAELRFDFGSIHQEIWIGYKLHIPSNYVHRWAPGGNNKAWATCWDAGGDSSYGSSHVGLEPNFWDDGTGDSSGTFYVFGDNPLGRANDNGGTHLYPEDCPTCWPNGDKYIDIPSDQNKVIEVVIHYKYATAEGAGANGVAEIWRRRLTPTTLAAETSWIKVTNITNGDWYSVGQEGFGYCYFLGWANSGFTDQTIMHMGDFWIATTDLSGASE